MRGADLSHFVGGHCIDCCPFRAGHWSQYFFVTRLFGLNITSRGYHFYLNVHYSRTGVHFFYERKGTNYLGISIYRNVAFISNMIYFVRASHCSVFFATFLFSCSKFWLGGSFSSNSWLRNVSYHHCSICLGPPLLFRWLDFCRMEKYVKHGFTDVPSWLIWTM